MQKKIFSLLVLLMTAVSGAWADETVTYALTTGDTFTSGQTIEVKNDANDVVATITYGESGGADFKEAKANSSVSGFTAFTEGNGENGNKTGGTFYTITPKVDATITVAVVLNKDKNFYILEDGTALADYNGITVSDKYYGTYEFDAKANKAYKVYCAGSKLGFYGFAMTYSPVVPVTVVEVTPTGNKNEWEFTMPDYAVVAKIEYDTELALNEEVENAATLEEWDGYEADVTLTRTLVAGSWNTFAAPFNVSSTMLGHLTSTYGMQVKQLTTVDVDGEHITLNFENATEMVAGTPYLVKVTSDFDFSAQALPNVEVSQELNPVQTDYIDFIPTLGKTTIEGVDAENILFVAMGNKLKNPSEMPAYMKGFRAYFLLKDASTARSFVLNIDGESTGITTTDFTDSTDKAGAVYDLQGRKVNAAQKGVYIQNGKKTVVK